MDCMDHHRYSLFHHFMKNTALPSREYYFGNDRKNYIGELQEKVQSVTTTVKESKQFINHSFIYVQRSREISGLQNHFHHPIPPNSAIIFSSWSVSTCSQLNSTRVLRLDVVQATAEALKACCCSELQVSDYTAYKHRPSITTPHCQSN